MLLEKGCQISNLHSFLSFFSLYLFLKHQMHFTTRKRKKFWKFAFSYACESTLVWSLSLRKNKFYDKTFFIPFFLQGRSWYLWMYYGFKSQSVWRRFLSSYGIDVRCSYQSSDARLEQFSQYHYLLCPWWWFQVCYFFC